MVKTGRKHRPSESGSQSQTNLGLNTTNPQTNDTLERAFSHFGMVILMVATYWGFGKDYIK